MAVAGIALACLNGAAGFFGQQLAAVLLGFCKCSKLDKEKLQKLGETLNTFNGLLNDAEEKQITEAGRDLVTVLVLKTWIADVKEAVYEAVDLLIDSRQIELEADSQTGMYEVRNHLISYLCPLSKNEEGEMAYKLEKIFEKLEMLEKKARSLDLKKHTREQPPSHEHVPKTSRLGTTRVYGRDEAKEDIKELLLSDEAKRESLQVIPIVGMPGIGKTTIARFVYNDSEVQDWFDFKAWVHVSQDLNVLKLTKNILKELGFLDCDSMPFDTLQGKIEGILMNKKLLLVLDNFWSYNRDECDFFLAPLMVGAKGSKVIITTREKSGASSALQTLEPYPLQGINIDDCWSLFSEYAFSGPNSNACSQFEEMFRSEVVRRCNGLPLTARLLGGLLKSKTNADDWRKILNSNMWDLRDDRGLHVLKVSYYCLPAHLKQCFCILCNFSQGL